VILDHQKVIPDHFFSTSGRLKPAEIGKKAPEPCPFDSERAFSCTPARTELAWDHIEVIRDHKKVILKPFLSPRGRIPMPNDAGKVTERRFDEPERQIPLLAAREEVICDGKNVICTN